jgi:hypothetical protein
MVPSMRVGSRRQRLIGTFMLMAVQITFSLAAQAEEQKTCILTFAPPDSLVLHYVDFSQTNQNYRGIDVAFNQTSEVEMFSAGKTEDGNSKIDLKFIKVKSSLLSNNELRDWTPPIKLEGASIRVTVSPGGEVVKFDPGRNIPGLREPEDLRNVINPWFVKLPDTTVAVGQSWKQQIVEGKKEGAEPAVTGEAVYTLKKIEKKGDLEIAVIEGKVNLKMNSEAGEGVLVADGKADVKAQVVIAGGYLLELKENLEIRGNTIVKDPLTDKETKHETAVTTTVEIKRQ